MMKELVVCGNTQWYSELVKSLEDDVQPVLVLQLYMSVMCVVWILSPIFINNKIILVANIVLRLEQYCLQKVFFINCYNQAIRKVSVLSDLYKNLLIVTICSYSVNILFNLQTGLLLATVLGTNICLLIC